MQLALASSRLLVGCRCALHDLKRLPLVLPGSGEKLAAQTCQTLSKALHSLTATHRRSSKTVEAHSSRVSLCALCKVP